MILTQKDLKYKPRKIVNQKRLIFPLICLLLIVSQRIFYFEIDLNRDDALKS